MTALQPVFAYSIANQAAGLTPTLYRLFTVLLTTLTFSLASPPIKANADYRLKLGHTNDGLLQQQRKHYLRAREALRQGHMVNYRKNRDRLINYPLLPYLDYYELSRQLNRLPYNKIEAFLEAHESEYLAERLHKRWLFTLAKRQRWHDFLTYYDASLDNLELHCHQLYARYKTGDRSALDEVAPVWNVPHSQPDECTPIFKVWMADGRLSPVMAWERFSKALGESNTSLARYLNKLLSPEDQRYGNLALQLRNYPHKIRQRDRYQEQSPKMQTVIAYGIQRYARQDPRSALYQWQRYDAQQFFSDNLRNDVQHSLLSQLVRRGHNQAAEEWLQQLPQITSEKLIAELARDALKVQDWQKVYNHIQRLPVEAQAEPRWQYWLARSQQQLPQFRDAQPTPEQRFKTLAMGRGYYSFLAADRLGHAYRLGDTPVTPSQDTLLAIAKAPATLRVRELLAASEVKAARREWIGITSKLDQQGHLAAAQLAHQWGWHRKTIQSLAAVKYWDDLQLRFPLAYNKQMLKVAQQQRVSPPLLFAIARQESAFAPDAKSPAGAMGLMQLLPSTARYTARKAGVNYRQQDLLEPETNITLGSHYIRELLEQFDGNRILASAAYNAGPHRVQTWLKASNQQLPHDIWVETIPFKETRKYVQNILAYSVIYGYRMGRSLPLLSEQEMKQRL